MKKTTALGKLNFVVIAGVMDPDPLVWGTAPDPSISKQKIVRKTLILIALWLLYDFFIWKQCGIRNIKNRGIFFEFFKMYSVHNSTLLHPSTIRFECVGGCWDRTQDCCDYGIVINRTVDPDPALQVNQVRFQSGSRISMTKNWRKKYSRNFLKSFLIKNCNVPATTEAFSPQKRTSRTKKNKIY